MADGGEHDAAVIGASGLLGEAVPGTHAVRVGVVSTGMRPQPPVGVKQWREQDGGLHGGSDTSADPSKTSRYLLGRKEDQVEGPEGVWGGLEGVQFGLSTGCTGRGSGRAGTREEQQGLNLERLPLSSLSSGGAGGGLVL